MDSPPSANVTFISHASEDKRFVKNLVDTLARFGVNAWYDDYRIDVGDSIRSSINQGLRSSEFGVVVLSHNFFRKPWPKAELAALSSILGEGRILPVLYNISHEQVAAYDPLLSDIKGLPYLCDARNVAAPIARKVRGGSLANGEAQHFFGETLRVQDLLLDESQALVDMNFEECVLQGLAMINLGPGRVYSFVDCYYNSDAMFIRLAPPYSIVGAYGLRNVSFARCRFKDIGFISSPEEIDRLQASMSRVPSSDQFPLHLR